MFIAGFSVRLLGMLSSCFKLAFQLKNCYHGLHHRTLGNLSCKALVFLWFFMLGKMNSEDIFTLFFNFLLGANRI